MIDTRSGSVDELVLCWQREQDPAALDELFSRLLPLVRKLARRYVSANEPLEDLVQVGSVGLMGAITRYEPGRSTSFASFAVPTILGEIKRHFRNTGWSVHVPRGAQELALRISQAVPVLTAQTGRAPDVTELAANLDISLEDALVGLEASQAHYAQSLDAPINEADADTDLTLGESLGREDQHLGLVETTTALAAAFTRLPYLERRALKLRVEHDMKQSEIAQRLGCSQMQVSRLLRRAATNVRNMTDPNIASPTI